MGASRPKQMHPIHNQFQFDLATCRRIMKYQLGTRLLIPKMSICKHWEWGDNTGTHFGVRIMKPSYAGKFIAVGICDDGLKIDLTASICMLRDTRVIWKPVPDEFMKKHIDSLSTKNHENSMERAQHIVDTLASYSGAKTLRATDIILTLDGNCENRIAMQQAFSQLDASKRPRIITVEMDPVVALCQRLMGGGRDVIYTGADPRFRSKDLIGGRISTPKLEHLLLKENTLLPDHVKERIVAAYFDYCGGPIATHDPDVCSKNMRSVIAQLPSLRVLGMTISKRQHANLDENFSQYVGVLDTFALSASFNSNARVVSNVYMRKKTSTAPNAPTFHSGMPHWKHTCNQYNKKSNKNSNKKSKKKSNNNKSVVGICKRRAYKCGLCGRMKKGHVCPVK